MATAAEREPRGHHYVPKCWLAGFTETGEKDSRLWVTDLGRRNQWATTPVKAGRQRDFYRTSADELDPVAFEKLLCRVEDSVAPLLKSLHKKPPTRDELQVLLLFMAMQWARVPAFRPFMLNLADTVTRTQLEKSLASPQTWTALMEDIGIPVSERIDYERMLEYHRSTPYTVSAPTEWYLLRGVQAVQHVLPILESRIWKPFVSTTGSFIGSDNPVILEGPKDAMIGFKNAEILLYPVSRHLLVYGTLDSRVWIRENRNNIARINTQIMLSADQQVFSHSRTSVGWTRTTSIRQTGISFRRRRLFPE